MSQLGWIDFSPDDRNKVRNVLAMLSEPGTLDELGIGQVRDAFSDLLFPGISTIQTRAKYFITVPRILRDYQALTPSKKRSYKSLEKYLVDRENEVAQILVSVHDDNEYGIIGRTRIDSGGVDRRPSVVYWNGLRTFAIVSTQLSLSEFCQQQEGHGHHSSSVEHDLNEGSDDADVLKDKNLIVLPDDNSGWIEDGEFGIELSHKEAEFLKGKMTETAGLEFSVPAQLFKYHLSDKALMESADTELNRFDVLTKVLLSHDDVDDKCKQYIKLAHQFSLAMEGPHIRYNILLAKNNGYDDCVKEYEHDYSTWLDVIKDENIFTPGKADEWLAVAEIDQGRHIKSASKTFIRKWCEAIQQNISKKKLDGMVASQADSNKGERSLLKRKLGSEKWMGIRRLDYRWDTARTIIKDIQDGLNAVA